MSRALWIAAFLLFTAVCVGFWGVSVWRDRTHTVEQVESQAITVAQLLELHADQALSASSRLVDSLAMQASRWDLQDGAVGRELHERLATAVRSNLQLISVWVVDAAGRVALSSREWPTEPLDYAYRHYYRVHAGGHEGLYIGAPETGAIAGSDRFTLSRAILGPDGTFKGVAVAGVLSSYLRRVYEEAYTPDDTRISLFKTNGALLAAGPPETGAAPLDSAGPYNPIGTVVQRGKDRIRAIRAMDSLPVVVAADLPLAPALARWQERAWFGAVVPAAAVLGFALLMVSGLRGVQRLEDANHELETRIEDRTTALGLNEAMARDGERELQLVADAVPALIAFVGRNQRYRYVNKAYAEWLGRERHEIEGHLVSEVLSSAAYRQVVGFIRRVLYGESVREELDMIDAHGRERALDAQYIPRQEPDGRISGFYLFANDVSERKDAERRQWLLMAELDHRVRNILATIQSMVTLTEAATDSKSAFSAALRGRIGAMARTHGLLTAHRWTGANVIDIIRDELSAYAPDEKAFSIECEDVCILSPEQALNVALVMHELATNAAKYGALSRAGGHVTVRCAVESVADGHVADIVWQESGGPPVEKVGQSGFGSQLITGALGGHGETRVDLAFPRDGARCHIRLQLTRRPDGVGTAEDDGPESRAAVTAGDSAPEQDLNGLTVLVAEDERLVEMDLERQLAEWGSSVLGPAASLETVMRIAERSHVDLAVLDINLAGESSEPVAATLLARGVPVLFVTGYQAGSMLPKSMQAVPSLQKPVDPALLRRTLGRLARGMPSAEST